MTNKDRIKIGVAAIAILFAIIFMVLAHTRGWKALRENRATLPTKVIEKYSVGGETEQFYAVVQVNGKQFSKHIHHGDYRNLKIGETYNMSYMYGECDVRHPDYKSSTTYHIWQFVGIAIAFIDVIIIVWIVYFMGCYIINWLED